MDVLFFIESLGCGGAEKSIVSLLQLLDYSKINVDLMLLRRGGCYQSLVPNEVNVIDFPQVTGLRHRLAHARYAVTWRLHNTMGIKRHEAETLWQSIGRTLPPLAKRYDVAVAYQQGFPTYYVATKVNANKKIAWINADIIKAGYRRDFNRVFYEKFDHVSAVSEQLMALLKTSGYVPAERLTNIYDILNVNVIRKLAQDGSCHSDNDKLSLVTVGRLEKPKNYILAVETAKILRDRGLEFVWTFVGEGSQRQNIETAISQYGLQEYVKLAGLQENPYPYIAQADIYVQTSSFEGFGLTIAEAKILHRPIVSTNFDVVHDQITDGENGLIAEMTPVSIADAIIRLVNDKPLRDKLVKALENEENTTAQTEVAKFYSIIGL